MTKTLEVLRHLIFPYAAQVWSFEFRLLDIICDLRFVFWDLSGWADGAYALKDRVCRDNANLDTSPYPAYFRWQKPVLTG